MTSSLAEQKLSLRALIALVVGSMIGSGIFAIPSAFGRATGGLGALIAWAIAGVGMLMLAFVFQTLARRKPELDAGIYAYAKAGFGDYLGFASAVGYWIGCCLADVACLVLIKATLGQFLPVFGDGTTPVAIASASALLWGVHLLILRGVKEAAALNTIATFAKIVPIAVFIVVAIPFVLLALLAFLFAGIAALALAVPLWASALIVGGVLLLIALLFAFIGMRSVRKAGMPTPDSAIVEAKATVEDIKEARTA